jgi:hypothetical protein
MTEQPVGGLDKIALSNLHRLPAARRIDAMTWLPREGNPRWITRIGEALSTPKTRRADGNVRRANRTTKVTKLRCDVSDPRAIAALTQVAPSDRVQIDVHECATQWAANARLARTGRMAGTMKGSGATRCWPGVHQRAWSPALLGATWRVGAKRPRLRWRSHVARRTASTDCST